MADWIKKQDPCICCIQEEHLRPKDTHKLKVKGWKMYSMQMAKKRKLVQYLHQTKQTLKQKLTRDKEGHYIMIKGTIQKEDITFVNIYAPNVGAHKANIYRQKRRN